MGYRMTLSRYVQNSWYCFMRFFLIAMNGSMDEKNAMIPVLPLSQSASFNIVNTRAQCVAPESLFESQLHLRV